MAGITRSAGWNVDDAVSWYNRNLALVLGLNPGTQPAQLEKLSGLRTPEQRRALARVIEGRLRRVEDEATGAVRIETVGEPLAIVATEPDEDPQIATMTQGYLASARSMLTGIDPSQVSPAHSGELVDVLWQSGAVLELLIAEAPRPRGRFLTFTYLHELTRSGGLLPRLGELFDRCGRQERRTVELERIIATVRAARRALDCFAEAYTEYAGLDEEPTLLETIEIVRRCAGHIGARVEEVRHELRLAGVGECEMEDYQVELAATAELGGAIFERISLADAFAVLKSESFRWMRFAARGGPDQLDAIRHSAAVLRHVVLPVRGNVVVGKFRLDAERAGQVSASIDRMTAYVLTVLDSILEGPGSRRGLTHDRAASAGPDGPPPGDDDAMPA